MLKSAIKILNSPSNGIAIGVRNLSLGSAKLEVYSDKVLRPCPFPSSYWKETDPTTYGKEFRAAPSSNTYSNFYNNETQKFEKMLIKKGKGYLAQRLMQTTLESIKLEQVGKYHKSTDDAEKESLVLDPVEVFHIAISNVKPKIGTNTFKKGAKSHKVPHPLKPRRQEYLAHKWILDTARLKNKKKEDKDKIRSQSNFVQRLTKEIMSAYRSEGPAMAKKYALHQDADASRAYAYLRFESNPHKRKLRGRKAAKLKKGKFGGKT